MHNFIEEMDNLVWLTNADLVVTWANPAAVKFLDLPLDEIVGRLVTDWLPEHERAPSAKAARNLRRAAHGNGFAVECRLTNDQGASIDAFWSLHAVHTPTKAIEGDGREGGVLQGFACCARDLTVRRVVARELQESQERLRAVVDAMLDPMVSIDAKGTILAANNAVERVFGYVPSELVGSNVKRLMPEPHRSLHDDYLARYRATGKTWILGRTRDFEVVRKDGTRLLCALSVSRADPPGKEPVFTGTFRDVTEKRRAEQQLRESELRFHALFDHSFEYLGLLSPDGHVIEANQTALDAAGLDRETVLGKLFWETPWWSHSGELRDRLREAVQAAARGEFVRFEATHPARDGGTVEMDFSIKPVRNAQGEIVMLLPEGRNISEIKRAQRSETAMLRALATIGESAALLAHEIKNPITAVNLALRAVADQLGEDHKEVLEDLVTRMQRLEQMMRRTLSFAKPLDLKRASADGRRFVDECVLHLRSQLVKSGADVRVDVATGCPPLWIDPQLGEEVVANLVTNAIEAHPARARIGISLARSGDREVLLAIEDDGPGIPESIRATLFKLFVTTKKKGNGFGLAICKKIVEEHGGSIQVGSSAAGGARFEIRLPVKP
ncbi:MAG: PAS domain S-box protein [Planctomycetes bacterium]|nr:PAS domain S-box protein [Planctomycetota bacterium]